MTSSSAVSPGAVDKTKVKGPVFSRARQEGSLGRRFKGTLWAEAPRLVGDSSWELGPGSHCLAAYGRLPCCWPHSRPWRFKTEGLAEETQIRLVLAHCGPALSRGTSSSLSTCWSGGRGATREGICTGLRAWDWISPYEQMPCLSRPAPTCSLGHSEEGSLARSQRWWQRPDWAWGCLDSQTGARGESGHTPNLSPALSQLIMELIRSCFF